MKGRAIRHVWHRAYSYRTRTGKKVMVAAHAEHVRR